MPYTIDDVAQTRIVNGHEVPLSIAERQALCDEWNANEVARQQREQLEQQRVARKAALDAEAVADAFIDRLRGATPQEIKDYVQGAVTDLPSAKAFIGKLACAVAYALVGGTDK